MRTSRAEAIARTFSIAYAGLTVGDGQGDANYTLLDDFRFQHQADRATVTFSVGIQASTPSSFLASEAALYAAYRKIDQDLTVTLGSTRHSFSHANNTGFNARASCKKTPGPDATDRSGRYECAVTVMLPADFTGRDGRLASTFNLSVAASGLRTATFSGTYTALSNKAAREQFESVFSAYAETTVLGGLGGTWEQIAEPETKVDDQDKVLTFTRVYKEIRFNQSAAGTNHAALVDPRLVIKKRLESARAAINEFQSQAQALTKYSVEYSAEVKFDVTTDLDNLWETTVKPFVLSQTQDQTGAGSLVIVGEEYGVEPYTNRLMASLQMIADEGAPFIQAHVMWTRKEDKGLILRPVWNGDPYARDREQGMASDVREVTYVVAYPYVLSVGSNWPEVPEEITAPSYEGYLLVRESESFRSKSVGIAGQEFPIMVATKKFVFVRANVVSGSSAAAER